MKKFLKIMAMSFIVAAIICAAGCAGKTKSTENENQGDSNQTAPVVSGGNSNSSNGPDNLPPGPNNSANMPHGPNGSANMPPGPNGSANMPPGPNGSANMPQGSGGSDNMPPAPNVNIASNNTTQG
jgi:hypothetical protein